jgi:glycosyltransferase involved in cell wall biosynthesis
MKIVFVTDTYAPAWGYGGAAKLTSLWAGELNRMGHEVDVLTTDALDHGRTRVSSYEGVSISRERNISNYVAWQRKIFLPLPKLKDFSLLKRADVVHLIGTRSLLNAEASVISRINNIPIAFSPVGTLPLVGQWDRPLKSTYDLTISRIARRQIAAALGQTEHEMLLCISWGIEKERVHLVPLCVDLEEYSKMPPRGGFVAKHPKLRSYEQIYTFIGRISKYKGIEMLMNAFRDAFKGRECALVIAGRGEEGHESYLRHLAMNLGISTQVFFPGQIYGLQKNEALTDSHAFVITPSIYEETSLASLEAAACYSPIVTTRQSDVPYLLKYEAGFVSEFDREEIVENLSRISDIKGSRRMEMGKRARRMVEERFSLPEVSKVLEATYRKVV